MITDTELQKLQKLAKLNFTEAESKTFTLKLRRVMDMINELQKVDCSEVEPLRSVCDMDQRMRFDEVKVSDVSHDVFKNIPNNGANFAKEVKCFVVPKVIE